MDILKQLAWCIAVAALLAFIVIYGAFREGDRQMHIHCEAGQCIYYDDV